MKLTVIYDDHFISVDNKGMHFHDNWPFEETDIHAIQWCDGEGELEYRGRVLNKELTDQKEVQKYIDFHQEEYAKWSEEQERIAEEERRRLVTWDEAMKELELQMGTMQKNHEDMLYKIKSEHDLQIERVQENHMNLFNAANALQGNIAENEVIYDNVTSYDNMTVFDGNVDPSLFDDSIDPSLFHDSIDPSLLDGEQEPKTALQDFNNFNLELLEDEFNLEMLFEEEPDPVVNEIEELINKDYNSSESIDAADLSEPEIVEDNEGTETKTETNT
jgi:hypothetical protein